MNIVNTYHLGVPSMVEGASLLAVLMGDTSEGTGRDYRVYVGIVSLDAGSSDYQKQRNAAAEWISRRGQKLTYREAIGYFPNIPEILYTH